MAGWQRAHGRGPSEAKSKRAAEQSSVELPNGRVVCSQVLAEWPPLMLNAEPLPLWGSLLEAVLNQFEAREDDGAPQTRLNSLNARRKRAACLAVRARLFRGARPPAWQR